MSVRGGSEAVGSHDPQLQGTPQEGKPPRMATPNPSRLSEALGSDDSRRWKVPHPTPSLSPQPSQNS